MRNTLTLNYLLWNPFLYPLHVTIIPFLFLCYKFCFLSALLHFLSFIRRVLSPPKVLNHGFSIYHRARWLPTWTWTISPETHRPLFDPERKPSDIYLYDWLPAWWPGPRANDRQICHPSPPRPTNGLAWNPLRELDWCPNGVFQDKGISLFGTHGRFYRYSATNSAPSQRSTKRRPIAVCYPKKEFSPISKSKTSRTMAAQEHTRSWAAAYLLGPLRPFLQPGFTDDTQIHYLHSWQLYRYNFNTSTYSRYWLCQNHHRGVIAFFFSKTPVICCVYSGHSLIYTVYRSVVHSWSLCVSHAWLYDLAFLIVVSFSCNFFENQEVFIFKVGGVTIEKGTHC